MSCVPHPPLLPSTAPVSFSSGSRLPSNLHSSPQPPTCLLRVCPEFLSLSVVCAPDSRALVDRQGVRPASVSSCGPPPPASLGVLIGASVTGPARTRGAGSFCASSAGSGPRCGPVAAHSPRGPGALEVPSPCLSSSAAACARSRACAPGSGPRVRVTDGDAAVWDSCERAPQTTTLPALPEPRAPRVLVFLYDRGGRTSGRRGEWLVLGSDVPVRLLVGPLVVVPVLWRHGGPTETRRNRSCRTGAAGLQCAAGTWRREPGRVGYLRCSTRTRAEGRVRECVLVKFRLAFRPTPATGAPLFAPA